MGLDLFRLLYSTRSGLEAMQMESEGKTNDKRKRRARLFLPVFVYEGVEGHAVLPAGGEVCDVDAGIPASHHWEIFSVSVCSVRQLVTAINLLLQTYYLSGYL